MIHHGDLFDVLPTLAAESVDACVTDPPYGIGFMGREWDTFKPGVEAKRIVPNRAIESDNPNLRGRTRGPASSPSAVEYDRTPIGQLAFEQWTERWAREVFRVLKPGAHIIVCGAPRSFHRMACGLEDAGFEVRDCLSWLYGQGFPKSLNLGTGLGTALKPSWEPCVLARKPFKGTVEGNVQTHGTGALNIDACRIDAEPELADNWNRMQSTRQGIASEGLGAIDLRGYVPSGRWPANVVLDEAAAALLDEQSGELHARGASRFYYVAKPSREERDFGVYDLAPRSGGEATDRIDGSAGLNNPRAGAGRTGGARNIHPTVKPVELMRWLVKLVTPPGGVVLDPFTGSGTTWMACRYEMREFVGIEREDEYVEIAKRRAAAVAPLFESGLSNPDAVDPVRAARGTDKDARAGDLFSTGVADV